MKRIVSAVLVFAAWCTVAVPGWAMSTTERIEGKYTPVSPTPEISQELADIGNLPGRVYGERVFSSEIGDTERLYFAGDTAAFNKFLAQYARLSFRPLVLTIMTGGEAPPPQLVSMQKGQTDCEGKPVQVQNVVYDWVFERYLPDPLSENKSETVNLTVWPGRRVEQDKIKIPQGVEVRHELAYPLREIAELVKSASAGKSRLLIDKALSANPKVGMVVRPVDWGNLPFITVYPVLKPVKTSIEGIGGGYILGAVTMLVGASSPSGETKKAPAGAYMLFYRSYGVIGSDEAGPPYVSLLSPTWSNGTLKWTEALQARLEGHGPESGYHVPYLTVAFPGKGEVSNENPAWRVHIDMRWKEQMYRFRMDLDVTMV